jgi:hypothetical protein
MKKAVSKLKKLDHVILAAGEATGHHHRAIGGTLYQDQGGTLVLERGSDTEIRHEEHHAFTLPASPASSDLFDIRITQEYDHAAEAARNVAD